MNANIPKNVRALYVHVPFCRSKCFYCDFYSVRYSQLSCEGYLEAIDKDLEQSAEGLEPETVYVGGGTPTMLTCDQLVRLLESIARRVSLRQVREFTVEANP